MVVIYIIINSLKYWAAVSDSNYWIKTEKQKNDYKLTITAGIIFRIASIKVVELIGSINSLVCYIVYKDTELLVYIEFVIY